MNIGIIWSENISEETLRFYLFGKNKNCNNFDKFFNEEINVTLVKHSDLFPKQNEINSKFLEEFSALFILAELNWNGNALSDFYGIKVVQQLRLKNITAPIFICSFASENYPVKEKGFLILQSMGHYFIHLPTGITKDYEIRLLEEMELEDIQLHFCDIVGLIKTIWHKKPEALILPFEEGKKYIKGLLEDIRNIGNLPHAIYKETKKVEDELIKIEKESFSTFLDENTERRFLIHLEDSSENAVFNYSGGWEVLILEDKPDQVQTLKNRLEEIHLELKVHLVSTYSEAINKIKEDLFNRITVVIVDYRLEDSLGNFKGKQGYSFISWLIQQNRFTDIFVYSGQSRTSVLSTFKRFGIQINYKRKTEVEGKILEDFLEEIIDKGNQMYEALLNQPHTGIWDYSLRSFYAHYRNHKDYILFEQQISQDAKRYIKQLDYFLNLSINDEENGWFNSLMKGGIIIPPFKGVRKLQLRKVGHSVPPKPKRNGQDDEYYETFKKILVIRRIVLWLKNQTKIDNWLIIANLIFEGTFNSKSEKKDTKDKTLITYSCVSDGDYPSRILVEEKNWYKSIIHDYDDPESIIDKEKIVFFDMCIKNIYSLISSNIEIIKSQSDIFEAILPFIIISRIIEKERDNQPFTKIWKVLGEDFLEFLKYLFNINEFLLRNEIIHGHINSKDGSIKKIINKKLQPIIQMLNKEKAKIDYITPLRIFFSKDRGETVDVLEKYFYIEFEISCQHPHELLKLTNLLKRYPELKNNSVISKIEQELSMHINVDHYYGAD
ncbi:MAG: response regulator [Bacteroidales bacterium]|nr:response regulator [Bacteroidales bacterium]